MMLGRTFPSIPVTVTPRDISDGLDSGAAYQAQVRQGRVLVAFRDEPRPASGTSVHRTGSTARSGWPG